MISLRDKDLDRNPSTSSLTFCCKFSACCDQDRGSQFVMLCLGQKVCCHISRICSLICKNQDLTWACDRVNADITVNSFLCKSYENISRSYDLVYLRDALCSVCKCSDRLCTADFVDLICTGFFCRYQSG